MINVILSMLSVSTLWYLIRSKRMALEAVSGFPERDSIRVNDTSVFDMFSKEPDDENTQNTSDEGGNEISGEAQAPRYRSSYGEKFEFVKYLLAEKVHEIIVYRKRYTDPKFTLVDCANEVGFNRSYVSRAINEEYNKSFSSFVNDNRFNLLCVIVKQNPRLTREEYAHRSGFNSITTMMRVVKHKTGLSFRDWKLTQQ